MPAVTVVNPKGRRKGKLTVKRARALTKAWKARGMPVPAKIRRAAHGGAATVANRRRRHRATSNVKRKYRVTVRKVRANKKRRRRATSNVKRKYRVTVRKVRANRRRKRARRNAFATRRLRVGSLAKYFPHEERKWTVWTYGGAVLGFFTPAIVSGMVTGQTKNMIAGVVANGVTWLGGSIIFNMIKPTKAIAYGWFVGGAISFAFNVIGVLINAAMGKNVTSLSDEALSMDEMAAMTPGEQIKQLLVQGVGQPIVALKDKFGLKDVMRPKDEMFGAEPETLSQTAQVYANWLDEVKKATGLSEELIEA